MHLARLLLSTGFRMAALYAALFVCSALVLFGLLYWQTAGYMERQVRSTLDTEIRSLTEQHQHGGSTALQTAVHRRINSDRGTLLYLLRDSNGAVVESNLPLPDIATGWIEFRRPGDEEETGDRPGGPGDLIVGRGTRLSDGAVLFVGQEAHQLEETRSYGA